MTTDPLEGSSRAPRFLAALAALTLFAACRAADSPTAPDDTESPACVASLAAGARSSVAAGISTWAVLAGNTDSCITQQPDSHFVMRAAGVAPVGRLFLFLPGSAVGASYYQLILAQAAAAGYHAIGVTYPNGTTVAERCAALASSCYGDVRLELLTGKATTTAIDIDRANSIENRAIKLLRFMRSTEPSGNWGQFLVGDTAIAWTKVSVAGHSQGGAEALFIAQHYSVWRATAYASFGDALPNGSLAPWVTRPFTTQITRVFGLISAFDEVIAPVIALSAWSTIGLTGDPVEIEAQAPPFGTSQRFITSSVAVNRLLAASPNHNIVVLDLNTPKFGAAGTPSFAAVWRALSFPNP